MKMIEKLNLLIQRMKAPYDSVISKKLKGEKRAKALIDNAVDIIHKQELENIRIDNAGRKKHNDKELGRAKAEEGYKPVLFKFREISEAIRIHLDDVEFKYCLKNVKRKFCN